MVHKTLYAIIKQLGVKSKEDTLYTLGSMGLQAGCGTDTDKKDWNFVMIVFRWNMRSYLLYSKRFSSST